MMRTFEITENNKKYLLEFGWDTSLKTFFMIVRDGSIGRAGLPGHILYVGSPVGQLYDGVYCFQNACSRALEQIGLLCYELGDKLLADLVSDRDSNDPDAIENSTGVTFVNDQTLNRLKVQRTSPELEQALRERFGRNYSIRKVVEDYKFNSDIYREADRDDEYKRIVIRLRPIVDVMVEFYSLAGDNGN